jgi:GNAT superfamily N-acetyltransferase
MVEYREGCDNMDFRKVTEMLTTAYWSEGIGIDEVIRGAENSTLVVGAFLDGEQIGYARTVSDKTRFAYIMDVYVDERYRNQRIGQNLVNYLLDHESLKDVYQWMLSTRDAHGLYATCGFQPLSQPQRMMALRRVVKSAPTRRTII